MNKEDIKKLAIEQLSKETTVAKYFVTIDLQDEFVDRCILIAQQQVKKLNIDDEILENLNKAVDKYSKADLFEVHKLSEVLREIGCNLAYLTALRTEYAAKYSSVRFQSTGTSEQAKTREANEKVPELDMIRKILRHYGELQSDLRTQISLYKKHD